MRDFLRPSLDEDSFANWTCEIRTTMRPNSAQRRRLAKRHRPRSARLGLSIHAPSDYDVWMPEELDVPEPRPLNDATRPDPVTQLLNAAAAGDSKASNEFFQLIYEELRDIARKWMAVERPGHTLQATALVNEACLRLLGRPGARWDGRAHFFGAAAEAMRQILIDHARAHNAEKRGGGRQALSISSVADLAVMDDPSGFLALDDAILRMEKIDADAARVVRLRFYAGLTESAVAETLEISERSVRRKWTIARAWLRDDLECDTR